MKPNPHPVLSALLGRRSIRKFTADPVSEEVLGQILEAGFAAPSAKNYRPWHFVTVSERPVLHQLAAAHPHGRMLAEAAAAIVVCGVPADAEGEREFWLLDGAAATENMLVAAHALGLGAVWLGIYARPERERAFREVLSIPPQVGILCAIALGRPAETKPPHQGLETGKLHRERW
jgi:nitroreductase